MEWDQYFVGVTFGEAEMTIQIGQIVLIIALILFIVYVYRLRSVLLERFIYLACALVGLVLVIAPDFSTRIANLLGIGRGADLLVYLFIIAGLFYAVSLRARIKRHEQMLTDLVRQMALQKPEQGKTNPDRDAER